MKQELVNQAYVSIAKSMDRFADLLRERAEEISEEKHDESQEMKIKANELEGLFKEAKQKYPHLFNK